jgi:hypothetical protein
MVSSRASEWALGQPLSGRKKQLLLAIARSVDETGSCRSVTQESLAAICNCTVRQVRRLVGSWQPRDTFAHQAHMEEIPPPEAQKYNGTAISLASQCSSTPKFVYEYANTADPAA